MKLYVRRIIHNYYLSVFVCLAPRSIERYPVPSINRLINVNEICKKSVFSAHRSPNLKLLTQCLVLIIENWV